MEAKKTRHEQNKDYFWGIVKPECAICGYDKLVSNLYSHHLDAASKWDKTDSLGKWLNLSRKEMLNCIVTTKFIILCCRCHREVHWDLRHGKEVNLTPVDIKLFLSEKLKADMQPPKVKVSKVKPVKAEIPPPPPEPRPPFFPLPIPPRNLPSNVGGRKKKPPATIHGSDIGLETPEEIDMMNEMIKLYDMNIRKVTLFDDTTSYMVDTKVHGPDMKPEHLALFRKIIFWHHDVFIESMKNHNRNEQRKKEARLAAGYS